MECSRSCPTPALLLLCSCRSVVAAPPRSSGYPRAPSKRLSSRHHSTYATATIGIGVDGYLVLGDSTHTAQATFSNAFQFYKSAGDAHLYLSDLVHSRNMLIITPAVGTSTFAFGGNATITGGADTVQLTVTGNSTQTKNLQNWCNGSGAALSYIDVNGRFCCQVTSGPNAMAAYNAGTTGTVSGLLAQAWGTNSSGTNIGLNAVAQSAEYQLRSASNVQHGRRRLRGLQQRQGHRPRQRQLRSVRGPRRRLPDGRYPAVAAYQLDRGVQDQFRRSVLGTAGGSARLEERGLHGGWDRANPAGIRCVRWLGRSLFRPPAR